MITEAWQQTFLIHVLTCFVRCQLLSVLNNIFATSIRVLMALHSTTSRAVDLPHLYKAVSLLLCPVDLGSVLYALVSLRTSLAAREPSRLAPSFGWLVPPSSVPRKTSVSSSTGLNTHEFKHQMPRAFTRLLASYFKFIRGREHQPSYQCHTPCHTPSLWGNLRASWLGRREFEALLVFTRLI